LHFYFFNSDEQQAVHHHHRESYKSDDKVLLNGKNLRETFGAEQQHETRTPPRRAGAGAPQHARLPAQQRVPQLCLPKRQASTGAPARAPGLPRLTASPRQSRRKREKKKQKTKQSARYFRNLPSQHNFPGGGRGGGGLC